MPRPVIALDADGVLLDFHVAYARAWERAFGKHPSVRDPQAYWPIDYWDVERLGVFGRRRFRKQFGEAFWATVPPIAGAREACLRLHEAGYELVCVSALATEYAAARLRNLRDLEFPIESVIATGSEVGPRSPKADAVTELRAQAFVDDYLPFMRGVPDEVHTALVMRAPNGSPNVGDELQRVRSVHDHLSGFVDHWLQR